MFKKIFPIRREKNLIRAEKLSLVFFGCVALFNLVYAIFFIIHITEAGLVDMNRYWNCGLYIRRNMNPYHAHLNKIELSLPIRLVGGSSVDSGLANTLLFLPGYPGNTAPFVFLFSVFSFLPLKYAAVIWSVLNILFAVFIPLIILKIFRAYGISLPEYFEVLSVLVFFSLNMTFRGIIGNGQTTSLIFLFLCLSVLFFKRGQPIFAGLVLGLALSKYNVAVPVFIFFLMRRQFKILSIAVLVQLIGVLFLSLWAWVSPIEIVEDYLAIAFFHATISYVHGINISAYFPKSILVSLGSFLIVTILYGVGFYFSAGRSTKIKLSSGQDDLPILNLLFLWTLLSLYHLGYDTILAVFPLLFIILRFYKIKTPLIFCRGVGLDMLLTVLALILLILPGSVFRLILPGTSLDSFAMTVAVGFFSIVSVRVTFPIYAETSQR